MMHRFVKLVKHHILILSNIIVNEFNENKSLLYSSKNSQIIAFIGSFIVGLGDSSLNTQVILISNNKIC